jgi:hypothetical protein
VQIDTAVFAYEPVLQRLQEIKNVELKDELLCWEEGVPIQPTSKPPTSIIRAIETPGSAGNPQRALGTKVKLDPAQTASLIMGLKQRVSLIQGPPGTGIHTPLAIYGMLKDLPRYGKIVSWCSHSQGLI